MSRITLAPNASGSGTLTVAAPNTNTDRTLTLPDVTTTLVGTDASQTLTNKSIAASQLTGALPAIDGSALTGLPAPAQLSTASGSAPSYSCRAWVNFNGTNGAIRASVNVSGVTRNSTGNYTVTFATAMQDANYSLIVQQDANVNNLTSCEVFSVSAGSAVVYSTVESNGAKNFRDSTYMFVAVFR